MAGKTRMHRLGDALAKELRDPEFRKAYGDLEEEFELAREAISLRLAAGLTQKQLAERAGTSQPAIARFESGRYHNVSVSFLRRVGRVLGVVPHIRFEKPRTKRSGVPRSRPC